MSKAVAVTRTGLDAAGREREAAASRRMLAPALVPEGHPRAEAACSAGMDRQTLRDRVGEVGPRRRLSPAQEIGGAEWVRRGPDLAAHGVVRWRRADPARVIAERFGVVLAERTTGTALRRLGFLRLVTRPRHLGHDAAAKASFSATSPPS